MFRGTWLPDILEADEELADDTLSSASTASFWGHERELGDPWWRTPPPKASDLRHEAQTPPLYRGLICTTPSAHRSYSTVAEGPPHRRREFESRKGQCPFGFHCRRRNLLCRRLPGGGGDGGSGAASAGASGTTGGTSPGPTSANGPSSVSQHRHQSNQQQKSTSAAARDPSQKVQFISELSYNEREERVRQLRERQQQERQQKLEELKEQAAAAHKFREQQEMVRRQRLEEIRSRDLDRRQQVEERRRIIEHSEQERREAMLRKNVDRDNRLEAKRRNERSSAVFAFGSSTPRMLDPKESYWSSRRATSSTNVSSTVDGLTVRRNSECIENDLGKKRATSAQGLNRKHDDADVTARPFTVSTAARRRTDLMPTIPSLRDSRSVRGSPRHRSPGRTVSLSRLDQLAQPRSQPSRLSPLHESATCASTHMNATQRMMSPAASKSKSMSNLVPQKARLGGREDDNAVAAGKDAHLDRRSSRSSLSLSQPRMTRGEVLKLNKMKAKATSSMSAQGVHSGTVTPGSPSRPTSALSQGSAGSQVALRVRSSPRKPRPLSIAGSAPSSADKPRDTASAVNSPSRESRSVERKIAPGVTSGKLSRARSVGSDTSVPSTPTRTPAKAPPKRTPAQVKAESAARRAAVADKARTVARARPASVPKSPPPPGSPASESKNAGEKEADKKCIPKESRSKNKENKQVKEKTEIPESVTEPVEEGGDKPTPLEAATPGSASAEEAPDNAVATVVSKEGKEVEETKPEESDEVAKELHEQVKPESDDQLVDVSSPPKPASQEDSEKPQLSSQDMESAGKELLPSPAGSLATEEECREEAQEERQLKQEQETVSEEENMMAEQATEEPAYSDKTKDEKCQSLNEEDEKCNSEEARKKEEELKKAEKNRKAEAMRREEEQRRLEAEEKLRREEEERQARKDRVAAIMARTRGKGGSSTPSKAESKTPTEEGKTLEDTTMTDSMIASISSSMTDSMIAEAIERHTEERESRESTEERESRESTEERESRESTEERESRESTEERESRESTEERESRESTEERESREERAETAESRPAEGENAAETVSDTQGNTETSDVQCPMLDLGGSSAQLYPESAIVTSEPSLVCITTVSDGVPQTLCGEDILDAPHVKRDAPIPMEMTPCQSVDLLGPLSCTVNGINHNEVDNAHSFANDTSSVDLLQSLDPLRSSFQVNVTSTDIPELKPVVDLGQMSLTKLSNEDAVNSNTASPAFIDVEQNLNIKKSTQDNTNLPDFLH